MNEDGVWQQLLKKKYLKNKTLAQVVKRPGDSQFWSGLMEVKAHFFLEGNLRYKMENIRDFGRICG